MADRFYREATDRGDAPQVSAERPEAALHAAALRVEADAIEAWDGFYTISTVQALRAAADFLAALAAPSVADTDETLCECGYPKREHRQGYSRMACRFKAAPAVAPPQPTCACGFNEVCPPLPVGMSCTPAHLMAESTAPSPLDPTPLEALQVLAEGAADSGDISVEYRVLSNELARASLSDFYMREVDRLRKQLAVWTGAAAPLQEPAAPFEGLDAKQWAEKCNYWYEQWKGVVEQRDSAIASAKILEDQIRADLAAPPAQSTEPETTEQMRERIADQIGVNPDELDEDLRMLEITGLVYSGEMVEVLPGFAFGLSEPHGRVSLFVPWLVAAAGSGDTATEALDEAMKILAGAVLRAAAPSQSQPAEERYDCDCGICNFCNGGPPPAAPQPETREPCPKCKGACADLWTNMGRSLSHLPGIIDGSTRRASAPEGDAEP